MDNPLDFTGRVVLVTGGTRGIGRAIAERYGGSGATVVVCGRRPPDAPDEVDHAGGEGARPGAEEPIAGTASPVGEPPGFIACDVREADQVDALVEEVVARHGRLDVVVNNAGGSPAADSATSSPRFSEAVVRLNLLAPLFVSQAAYRAMRSNPALPGVADAGTGSIVNVGSLSGVRPSPRTVAYGAAKAGLLNMTRTLAVEWAPHVRVNAIVVGLIATEQAHLVYGDAEARARVAATVPMGRLGQPSDVADACLLLSSSLAGYVTGATLAVHGGGEPPPYLAARDG